MLECKVNSLTATWPQTTTVYDGGTKIQIWCPGIKVQANISVKDYKDNGGHYDIGFVQRINYSHMKALYKNTGPKQKGTLLSWEQKHLPCFDGDLTADPHFYDASSVKRVISKGQSIDVELSDFPRLNLDPQVNGKRLRRAIKYNRFHIFLIVRKEKNGQKDCTYLRDIEWATKAEVLAKDNDADWDKDKMNVLGYKRITAEKSISWDLMRHITVLSAIRRNFFLDKKRDANTSQKFEEGDEKFYTKFFEFSLDSHKPVITV